MLSMRCRAPCSPRRASSTCTREARCPRARRASLSASRSRAIRHLRTRRWTPRSGASWPGSGTSSARASGASGAGLPLALNDAHQDGIVEAGVPLYGLTVASLYREPQFLVGGDCLVVELEGAKTHTIQAQLLEGVA